MPLEEFEMGRLAKEIGRRWDLETLTFFALDPFNYNLANRTPNVSLGLRAFKFISDLNSDDPPRDQQLLDRLLDEGPESLRDIVREIQKPRFEDAQGSEKPDAYQAIYLSGKPFLGRDNLREDLPDFANRGDSTRVLIVSGPQPCGKSYTFRFLKHLALNEAEAEIHHVSLEQMYLREAGNELTIRKFFEYVLKALRLDPPDGESTVATDDPQDFSAITQYSGWFNGQIGTLENRRWLIIDDLNLKVVKDPIRLAALAMAIEAENKVGNLWVVLLGYNEAVTTPLLADSVKERAAFPEVTKVAEYFRHLAVRGGTPFSSNEPLKWAKRRYPDKAAINKESMEKLRRAIIKDGRKLLQGQKP